MTQRILVCPVDMPMDECIALAEQENCCAVYHGVPPNLQQQAEEEHWVLPYVYIETIPDLPA